MDRRLIFARSASVAEWIAALVSSGTLAAGLRIWRFDGLALAFRSVWSVLSIINVVIAVLAPLCLGASLGVALWLAGDIWVKVSERWSMGGATQ